MSVKVAGQQLKIELPHITVLLLSQVKLVWETFPEAFYNALTPSEDLIFLPFYSYWVLI